MPWLLTLKLDKILFRKLNRGMEEYKMHTRKRATERAEQHDVKTRDIFSSLLNAKDLETGEELSRSELQSEAAILISAGTCPRYRRP